MKSSVSTIIHVTVVGVWINVVLVILKLFFGYWGHSDALVADGYHSVSDFITDLIVIIFVSTAYKRPDKEHPYGHGKFETMASLLIGLILLIVAFYIGFEGIHTIIRAALGEILPRPDVWTIVIAGISILAKEGCYRYTDRIGRKIGSSALRANALHHRSDAYSSIATLIGVSISFALGEHWRILDPIASVIISIFIAVSAWEIAKPAVDELLEISLPKEQIDEIQKLALAISGVRKIHNIRTRRNGHSCVIDLNIHVDPDITVRAAHMIATDVEVCLHESFGNNVIIYIHIEPD